MPYLVILEKGTTSWGAFSPDVPGCAAVGKTAEEALTRFREALGMHLEGLREDGLPIPEPHCRAEFVSV